MIAKVYAFVAESLFYGVVLLMFNGLDSVPGSVIGSITSSFNAGVGLAILIRVLLNFNKLFPNKKPPQPTKK